MSTSIPRDVQDFLNNYPNLEDDETKSANLEFYSNKRRCRPDNILVSELHSRWKGNYTTLERNHGFIQWLFPIQEHGMNYQAQPLQKHEIKAMNTDKEIGDRVLESYRLMLDFYGMQLEDPETGLLTRVSPEGKWQERYKNLVRSSHNYLRISRILKSLSEFGFERMNAGFLLHVLNEQTEHNKLNTQGIQSSMDRWWANCIRNEQERGWIGGMIAKARDDDEFVFTRKMYEDALKRRKETGSLNDEDAGTTQL